MSDILIIIALFIIAIVEVIRMIQNCIQIHYINKDTGARNNAYNEFVKSLKYTDKEFVERLLREFEEGGKENE